MTAQYIVVTYPRGAECATRSQPMDYDAAVEAAEAQRQADKQAAVWLELYVEPRPEEYRYVPG